MPLQSPHYLHENAKFMLVNEILGDHNVDKQITDNKGDVRGPFSVPMWKQTNVM